MYLAEREAARFYHLWIPLLHYVNQRRKVVPHFPEMWGDGKFSIPIEDAVQVRDVLWQEDALREAFIADNPAGLSQDDLALVESWRHRVEDDFFIFRHLKKYSIFIDGDSPSNAYGVLGITGPIEEVIGPYLPVYVKTVLLPFEDRIIYDSLLSSYPVSFGGGYKRALTETYRDVLERGGVITSLRPDTPDEAREKVLASNKKVLAAFQKELGASGLSPKMMQEHTGVIANFAGEYLNLQTPPRYLLDLTQKDVAAYRKLRDGDINLVSFKRLARFLRDSDRMDWDEAERLLKYLRRE